MRRLAVVLLLLLIGVSAVVIWRDLSRRLAVGRLCAAVEAGDWRHVLDVGPALVGSDPLGLRASDCLALAHFGAQDPAAAVEVLEASLAESDDWLPRPLLSMAVIEARRHQGRARAAADLARRSSAASPYDARLAIAEIESRMEIGDSVAVLKQMEARIEKLGPIPGLRPTVALRWSERGEIERARRVLGETPPRASSEQVDEWFQASCAVEAMAGDATAVAEAARSWVGLGGRRVEVMAWHALTLSIYQLEDPDFPVLSMLDQAADRRAELPPEIMQRIYRRLIGSLIVVGRHDDALVRLAEIELVAGEQDLGATRADIERSRDQHLAERGGLDPLATEGRLRFVPPRAWRGTLLVSPDLDAPADAAWQRSEIEAGATTTVRRRAGIAPQRWVLRDEDGATRASGTAWPSRRREVEVTMQPNEPALGTAFEPPLPSPADGVRRVRVLVLDCGDWRLIQYLRMRGDLPVLDALLTGGRRAVVWSDPPFTAAAMDALVTPADWPAIGVFASLQALGSELGSNPFLGGVDPVSGLRALVHKEPSLFEVIGAGERQALNLLFSKGKVAAGRHGEVVGPAGQSHRWSAWSDSRPLSAKELVRIPGQLDGLWRIWFESTAAVLDAFDTAAASDLDLVLTRVAAFDSATHAGFARAAGGGQDDGDHRLYDLYRYVDARLGSTLDFLDGDDVLIVLSDHGIRTAMEHDERSFLVVYGAGIETGRAPGRPNLRGVPRLLAELLGVETSWPWAGFEADFLRPSTAEGR